MTLGLSTTATHAIWLIATITAGSLTTLAWFDAAETIEAAREVRADLVDNRVDTALADARFCWDGDKVRVSAFNVGSSTIDTLNVSVIVDGIVAPGFVANVETAHDASFWQPGYNATFNKTGYAAPPDRVLLFTPEGVPAYAPEYTCPALNTIVFSPASASMDIGDAREFSVTGYDQFGALYIPGSYDWRSTCGTIVEIDFDTVSFTAGTVAGACALVATSEGVTGEADITIEPDAPASLAVSPDPVGVPAGGTRAFTATARDEYGNVNASSPITWSTDAGAIDAAGVLTAQTTAQLSRSVTATTTGGVAGSAVVDVYADAPQTATVSPDPEDVTVGATETFSVVLRDQYGNVNATAPVVWTTDAGTITAAGALTAQTTSADGRSVTATSGAASDSATVHVKPGAPSTIAISPDPTTVPAGGTRQFTATAYDSYGNVNATSAVSWSTNAGSIDAAGLLTAQTTAQSGRSVTATSGAVSATATVDVWAAAPASAVVSPDPVDVVAGATQEFNVVLTDAYGNVNATAPVAWTTDAGTVDGAGLLTAQTLAQSGRSVTATSGAASDSATVNVVAGPPATITVTPDPTSVVAGQQRAFSAVAYDQYGNVNADASFTWSTDGGSISSSGVLTAQTTTATGKLVTATSGSASGQATFDVIADVPASVVVSPDPVGIPAGGTRAFTATVRDQYGNLNTEAAVTWATDGGSVSAEGVLTAQTTAQLGRTVTATAGSASGSATVDVYAAATDRIAVSPAALTLYFNQTQQFTAVAYDAYDNANASVSFTWSATGGSIASNGLFTAPSVGGTVTVTASGDGTQGTATVSVRREVHVDAMATYKAGVPATSFRKGVDTVEVRTTVRDHENALVAGGASVTIEFVDPDGVVRHTASGTTSGSGVASASYALPAGARQGLWTARVSTMSGTDLVYNSGANVVTSVDFNVTPN